MSTIQSLIEKKQAQIAKLQAQVEVLEELAAETGQAAGRAPRRASKRSAGAPRRRGARRRPGENQRKVLAALSETPTRLRDIAAVAQLSLSATNSVLHAALKKGTVVKGTARGTYALKASAPRKRASKKKGLTTSPQKRKSARKASGGSKGAESATQESTPA